MNLQCAGWGITAVFALSCGWPSCDYTDFHPLMSVHDEVESTTWSGHHLCLLLVVIFKLLWWFLPPTVHDNSGKVAQSIQGCIIACKSASVQLWTGQWMHFKGPQCSVMQLSIKTSSLHRSRLHIRTSRGWLCIMRQNTLISVSSVISVNPIYLITTEFFLCLNLTLRISALFCLMITKWCKLLARIHNHHIP